MTLLLCYHRIVEGPSTPPLPSNRILTSTEGAAGYGSPPRMRDICRRSLHEGDDGPMGAHALPAATPLNPLGAMAIVAGTHVCVRFLLCRCSSVGRAVVQFPAIHCRRFRRRGFARRQRKFEPLTQVFSWPGSIPGSGRAHNKNAP